MILTIGLVLIAVAIAGMVLAVTHGAGEATGVARSLELLEMRPTSRTAVTRELSAGDRLVAPLLERTKALGHRLSPTGHPERTAKRLDKAGNPAAWPLERIYGAKGAGVVIGLVLGLLLKGFTLTGLVYAAVAAAGLFFLPDVLVHNAGTRRQDELRKGLADALDMLTVCVEAGQGFDAAFAQVARSIDGPISGEFSRVLSEIQIGRSRRDAFAALAERTDAPEIKTFVSALVQADRLGLPVAVVLREQSTQMRLIRKQRAEEKAQKVTVKIVFPVLLCLFPSIFIVILGPAVIRIMAVFSSQ